MDKYKSWMTTLFQMTASIHEGPHSKHPFHWAWLTVVELVGRNDPHEICKFLTFDDTTGDSLESLEDANDLITPLMNYIRECKGNYARPYER
jgi:hypothetical protein